MNRFFRLTVILIVCFILLAMLFTGCSSSVQDNSTEDVSSSEEYSETEQNSRSEENSTQAALPEDTEKESETAVVDNSEELNDEKEEDKELIQYRLTEDKCFYVVTGIIGETGEVEIPSVYKELNVIAIAEGAFAGNKNIKKVVLPNTVKSVGEKAFNNCSNLSEITLPDSIVKISNGCFDGTAWYNSQPDGMLYIGNILYGYKGTLSGELNIPDNTVCIALGALKGKTPTSIRLPFVGSTAIGSANRHFGYIFGAEKAETQNDYIPAQLTEITVKKCKYIISDSAFDGCKFEVNVEHSFGDWIVSVAANCNAEGTRYRFCSQCEHIEEENFILPHNCSDVWSTDEINHWYSCKNQGCDYRYQEGTHFWNDEKICAVCSRYQDAGMEFRFNSDLSEYSVYSYTGTESYVIIPSHCNGYPVTSIDDKAFQSCTGIISITIPNSITKIGSRAFSGCTSLESITIPGSVSKLGSYAFYRCISLTSVTLSHGLKIIGDRAFDGCSALESLTIPKTITEIGTFAFVNGPKLSEIAFEGDKAEWYAVVKKDPWNDFTEVFLVKCTDGKILYNREE